MMHAAELDAILLTTEAHLRYFSGFLSQFWQSPTRPWFLLLPLDAQPIAIIPTIGGASSGSSKNHGRVGLCQNWVRKPLK